MDLWCQEHGICVVAAHVLGLQNVIADRLSRSHLPLHEWELNWTYLEPVFMKWEFPDIDVFAPRSNKKVQSLLLPGREQPKVFRRWPSASVVAYL